MVVEIVAVGEVSEDGLAAVEGCIDAVLGLQPRRGAPLPDARFAWDEARRQYSSTLFLQRILETRASDAQRTLGVTEADLFIPMLTFVFGQAQLDGPVAVVSLARLRQEFYRLPPDRALLRERAAKEALHELGHTFGLVHCADRKCAMSLSSNITQVDAKRGAYCPGCKTLLGERRAAGSLTPGRTETHS
jgi:archaemetzincin